MKSNPLLKIDDLSIVFSQEGQQELVVDHISFEMKEGEILGIVGESGSGKTLTALSILGLLPENAHIISGNINFIGREMRNISYEEQRAIKGTEISMIFQDPLTSFNPVLTIGSQVEEMLRLHNRLEVNEYKKRTIKALSEAGLENAEDIYHKYPHQLSGGMRQRAMIAMAMIAGPKLLIADEPTTALDVTIQDKILMLLKKINKVYGTGIILVSHDLGVIKRICDRTLVMKDGRIVESGVASELLINPQTEYSKKLVEAAPITWIKQQNNIEKDAINVNPVTEEILRVEGLNVYYTEKQKGLFKGKRRKRVVSNAALTIGRGEAIGIVGESGSGKSTLAKAIAGLISDVEGSVAYINPTRQDIQYRASRIQMVFQDPFSSLNPVRRVSWILNEPLRIRGGFTKEQRKERVLAVLKQVQLEEEHLGRYLHQLSGGQRQRVAIAAALMLRPSLVILDEPVSSLDVTVQAQILSLLKELKEKYRLSYLFISHDLNVVYQMCDRICVMYQGEIVETRRTHKLFLRPSHEYTKVLLEASLPR